MKEYIGTKKISAKPMSRGEYNEYRGWNIPEDENPDDLGYLVEYQDSGESNHSDHDGYISWSPKKQFENAYQDISEGVSFDQAIFLAKEGKKISRKSWGNDVWLEFEQGTDQDDWQHHSRLNYLFKENDEDVNCIRSWFCNGFDMFAEDWVIVD